MDNQRYTGAKRAMARVEGVPADQMGLAKRWYDCVRVQVFGQFLALLSMVRAAEAGSLAGVLRAAAAFMAAKAAASAMGDLQGATYRCLRKKHPLQEFPNC